MVTAIPMDLLLFLDEERTGNSRKEDETAKNENTKDKKNDRIVLTKARWKKRTRKRVSREKAGRVARRQVVDAIAVGGRSERKEDEARDRV